MYNTRILFNVILIIKIIVLYTHKLLRNNTDVGIYLAICSRKLLNGTQTGVFGQYQIELGLNNTHTTMIGSSLIMASLPLIATDLPLLI